MQQADEPPRYEVFAGKFIATFYNLDKQSTGKSRGDAGFGITRSGKVATPYHTLAADPKVLPLGTVVRVVSRSIDHSFIVEDTGSAIRGNKLDVLVHTRQEALNLGVQEAKVYIITGGQ